MLPYEDMTAITERFAHVVPVEVDENGIFGFPNAISGTASQNCLDGSRTYGALPNPFTASIAAGTGAFPAVFLRFSA